MRQTLLLFLLQEPSFYDDRAMTVKESLKLLVVILALELSVLAVLAILNFMARILSRSNDFGDDDDMGIKKGMSGDFTNAGAGLGTDLSSGSLNCMKKFKYTDITR